MTAHVRTVAVGRPREVPGPRDGDTTRTAGWKEPVEGSVEVGPENLAGDEQADRVHHGGPDKAVYVYGEEDLAWWRHEIGAFDDQIFGQNLTTVGHDLRDAVVGERWRIGTAEFVIAQPRTPCFKLGLRAGDRGLPRRFTAAVRPGVYLRVATTGTLAAGDELHVLDRPAHGVTVAEAFAILHHDRDRAARLLEAPELPAGWHHWARERAARTR